MKKSFEIVTLDLNNDRVEVMSLIRKGLRDSFEESHLVWKHLENPFGISYAIGARSEGKLVGLRLFMRWEFIGPSGKMVKAIRPVDTVTDPEFRGMGIFKSLTLKGIEEEKQSYQLIFNTPNTNSREGYLKMGWEVLNSTLLIRWAIVLPGRKTDITEAKNQIPTQILEGWSTHKSAEFLKWRYQAEEYKAKMTSNQKAVMVYRMRKVKSVNTLVICELLGEEKWFAPLIKKVAELEKSPLVCYLTNHKTIKGVMHLPYKKEKPFIVFRDDAFQVAKEIQFSLGDLESKL